mgnify:CR=1 FL=1
MSIKQQIEQFLQSPVFGVVGASSKREKYGNKVLRCYQKNGRAVVPVHPSEASIEGARSVAAVSDLPASVKSISVITPPQVTEKVVEEAAAKGIENIWMQPGAQSPAAVSFCHEQGLNVIADGSCVLVELGCHED